jgi:hypothetical protein
MKALLWSVSAVMYPAFVRAPLRAFPCALRQLALLLRLRRPAGYGFPPKRGGAIPLVAYTSDHKGIVINTNAFHDLLEKTIADYTDQLRNPASVELRAAFRTKMNFICRIEGKHAEAQSA